MSATLMTKDVYRLIPIRHICGGHMTMTTALHDSKSHLEDLTRGQCLQYLHFGSTVGRVGFVLDGQPLIFPVNYQSAWEAVVFRTASGTALSGLDGVRVAFEVDSFRAFDRKGWGVVVQGLARRITDAGDLSRLQNGPLRSWAWGDPDLWFRISVDVLSGRRIIDT